MINLTTTNKFTTKDDVEELINNGEFKLSRDDWYHVALAAYQVNTLQDYVTTQIPLNGFYFVSSVLNTSVVESYTIPISAIALFDSPVTALKKGTILKDYEGTTAVINAVNLEEGTVTYQSYSIQNYSFIKNKPGINGVVLEGNKTSAELGIYDIGIYFTTAMLKKTEPSVVNTVALGTIGLLGRPFTALKRNDFIVDKYGTVAIIDTIDLENSTATYVTWAYHNYNNLENKPTLNGKVIQGNLTTADFGIRDGEQGPQGEVGPQGPQGEVGENGTDGTKWGIIQSSSLTENEDGTFELRLDKTSANTYPINSFLLDETGKVYKITEIGTGGFPVVKFYYTLVYQLTISGHISVDNAPKISNIDMSTSIVDRLQLNEKGITAGYADNEIEYEDKDNNYAYEDAYLEMRTPIVAGENITFEIDETNKVIKINASGGSSGGTNDYNELQNLPMLNGQQFKGHAWVTNTHSCDALLLQGAFVEDSDYYRKVLVNTILFYDKYIQNGDILIDPEGTIGRVSGISEPVGPVISSDKNLSFAEDIPVFLNAFNFDTSITPDLSLYDWSGYNEIEINGEKYYEHPLCNSTGGNLSGSPLALIKKESDPTVLGIVVYRPNPSTGEYSKTIVYTTTDGWLMEYCPTYTCSVSNISLTELGWTDYIFAAVCNYYVEYEILNSVKNNNMSLVSGQSIDKLVFNNSISSGKMINYLSQLPYDTPIPGVTEDNAIYELMSIDKRTIVNNGSTSYAYLSVYAINLNALNSVMGTSGYAIVINDDNFKVKRLLYISEYSEANAMFLSYSLAEGYTPNYSAENYGWVDTSDYTTFEYPTEEYYETINYLVGDIYDNKVGSFIGRDTRLWDVLSMFSLASAEGVSF